MSPTASVRRGDRVVVRLKRGDLMAKLLQRTGAKRIELAGFDPAQPPLSVPLTDLAWMARIIWASQ